MFKVLGRYVPPPAGMQAPSLWGTEDPLRTLFGDAAAAVQARPRHFAFRYRSAAHFVDVLRTWYGPVNKAFAAQTPEKAEGLAWSQARRAAAACAAGLGQPRSAIHGRVSFLERLLGDVGAPCRTLIG